MRGGHFIKIMAEEKRNYYAEDSLESVYNELRELEILLADSAQTIKFISVRAATARADYEFVKNNKLIDLFAEEAEKGTKRTEKQRESLYRVEFSTERLAANLAENDLKAERDLMDSIKTQINSVQTRARILETDVKLTR